MPPASGKHLKNQYDNFFAPGSMLDPMLDFLRGRRRAQKGVPTPCHIPRFPSRSTASQAAAWGAAAGWRGASNRDAPRVVQVPNALGIDCIERIGGSAPFGGQRRRGQAVEHRR
jgi:hypothetical protein